MMRKITLAVAILFTGWFIFADSGNDMTEDREAIEKVALDYIEGWYEGNVDRMKGCLHPDLQKREIYTVSQTGKSSFHLHSASTLIEGIRIGRGKSIPEKEREIEITIFDVSKNIASVRANSKLSIEYLHIVKYNRKWLVIDVLWRRN